MTITRSSQHSDFALIAYDGDEPSTEHLQAILDNGWPGLVPMPDYCPQAATRRLLSQSEREEEERYIGHMPFEHVETVRITTSGQVA